MKTKAYKLIQSPSGLDLEQKVNDCLDDGWILHGTPFEYDGYIFQAMTLHEK